MKGVGFYELDFLMVKDEDNLIAESITRILMTSPGERVGHPEFGCGLRRLLFESTANIFVSDVQRIINSAISKFEPRINLKDIQLQGVDNTIFIKLAFTKIGNPIDTNILEFSFDLESRI